MSALFYELTQWGWSQAIQCLVDDARYFKELHVIKTKEIMFLEDIAVMVG